MRRMVLVLISLMAFSVSASAEVCATSRTVDLPQWLKGGTNLRKTVYYISNLSGENLTIKVVFTSSDGTNYDESTESGDNIRFAGGFQSDPVTSSGATLSAGTTATVTNTSLGADAFGSATLTWEANSCVQSPLLVSARMEWGSTSDSWVQVNGGQRF